MRGPRLTQFVGRQHELQQLSALWEQAKAGKGQVALLCGEAGIGKSRVCEVFLERITADPHVTIRYQCALHHANSPFYPIIDQLERAANFNPEDAPDVKLEKLGAALSQAGAATLADIRSCAALLSIPTDELPATGPTPSRQKDLTIAALVRQMLGLARCNAGRYRTRRRPLGQFQHPRAVQPYHRVDQNGASIPADELQAGVLPAMA